MSDTEKITINLGAVDLGKIDLLVEHGHYTTRTDFIRTAIRSQLDKHNLEVQQSVTRQWYGVGAFNLIEPYRLRGTLVTLSLPENMAELLVQARSLPLRRALANLIDNALRYAGTALPLDVSVEVGAEQLSIEVADRGPGIPPDQVDMMRHPFTRLEQARSNTKGAGLGLAIVERIMQSHYGRLDLLPREGGGLRAILRIPITASSSSRARMAASSGGVQGA